MSLNLHRAAADASAELIERTQPKAVGVENLVVSGCQRLSILPFRV